MDELHRKHYIIDLDIVLPLDFERFARTWYGVGGRVGKKRGDGKFEWDRIEIAVFPPLLG